MSFHDDSERLAEWFEQALALDRPKDRQSLLNQVRQQSEELGQQLQEMLEIEGEADRFFELPDRPSPFRQSPGSSPLKAYATRASDPEDTGNGTRHLTDRIGRYQILDEIGKGGMGVVYRAEQLYPVKRLVALKVIKPGMDSEQIIARFKLERQALAMMDHPNIARVLDAGETANGLPYFVMELVDGSPITDYCDSQGFGVRQRMELFCQVCSALEHAHQKTVIHRDIKPTNVLVTQSDGHPLVKVIDFGIAKAIDGSLPTNPLYSEIFSGIGTVLYMSPEQAARRASKVDTRSDVYSLGMLLYDLLAGVLPFEQPDSLPDNSEEYRRRIVETNPDRPSRRVLRAGDQGVREAARRQCTPGQLSQALSGEPDWIVMKALEKDPNRRYQSARELGHDVERYLRGEAVLAGPPSTVYRFKRWAVRNRLAVTAATVVLAAVLVGSLAAVTAATRAMRAEKIAAANLWEKEQTENELRQLLYASDMKDVSAAFAGGDFPEMQAKLQRQVPRSGERDNRGFEWYVYRGVDDIQTQTVLDQGVRITCITMHPNGSKLAIGNAEGTIFLLRASDLEVVDQLQTDNGEAWQMNFVGHDRLLCGESHGTVSMYDLNSKELIDTYQVADERRVAVAWNEKRSGTFIAGKQGLVWWLPWNDDRFDSGGLVQVHRFPNRVEHMLVTHNQRAAGEPSVSKDWLVVGDASGNLAMLDPTSMELVFVDNTAAGMSSTKGLATSPNGLVARAQNRGLISVYRTDPLPELLARVLMPADLHSVAIDRSGSFLYAGDVRGNVYRLPISDDPYLRFLHSQASIRDRMQAWHLHDGKVESLGLHPDGERVLSGGRDGSVRYLMRIPQTYTWRDSRPITDLAFASDGTLYVTDTEVMELPPPYQPPLSSRPPQVELLEQSDLGLQMRIASEANVGLEVRDTNQVWRWVLGQPDERELVFDAGRELIRNWDVSEDGTILVMNLETPDPRSHRMIGLNTKDQHVLYEFECNLAKALTIAPDQSCFAFARNDDIELRELESGEYLASLTGHMSTISDLAFSRDSQRLASASFDRTVKCWNLIQRELEWSVLAHSNRALAVAFTPDGTRVVSAGVDSIIRFWATESGIEMGQLPVSEGPIANLEFDPKGESLAARTTRQGMLLYRPPAIESSQER